MLKRLTYYNKEESCFKPIGEIAQAVENTSTKDLILFIVYGQRLMEAQQPKMGEAVIIGFND